MRIKPKFRVTVFAAKLPPLSMAHHAHRCKPPQPRPLSPHSSHPRPLSSTPLLVLHSHSLRTPPPHTHSLHTPPLHTSPAPPLHILPLHTAPLHTPSLYTPPLHTFSFLL
ncbi:uncharacterized protein LOC135115086 [Scylla paramamosain]|uniref:uncharacterized protein LOC135115086 n=1 Tax=Scylla paramamosain TaxID=85552 RepID=UPI003083B482